MIIKEYKKHLVIMKGVGSDYVEEAFLILKSDLPKNAVSGDIVREANRIISEYRTGRKRKRLPFSLPSFLLGILSASVISVILFFIF